MGQPIEESAMAAVGAHRAETTVDELELELPLKHDFFNGAHGGTDLTGNDQVKRSSELASVTEIKPNDWSDKDEVALTLFRSQAKFVDALQLYVHDHEIEGLTKRQRQWITALSDAVAYLDGAALASLQEGFILALTAQLKKQGVL